jgi:hypothetical protein
MENDKDIKIETDEEVELDRSRKKWKMSFRLSLFTNKYNISFNMFHIPTNCTLIVCKT